MTPAWSTACPDWERRIVARESLVPFPPLFPAEAEAAMDIFRDLRIVDAAGSPRIGDSCRSWVLDFAAAVFGAYDAETGRRLINHFLLLISKKNSKSTIAAAIMLTALMRNWRKSGEYMIIAPTLEIANNAFQPAYDMIVASESLSALLHVQVAQRKITHRNTKATLKVIAADTQTVGGKKAIGVLVDELWMFGPRSGAENMLREAVGGLASRPEGFVIYLSTQSDQQPAGVFDQKLKYFRGVRDGRISDNKSLGMLYEFPKAMFDAEAYRDLSNAWVTNPNLELSVSPEFLKDELAKAEEAGEASLKSFFAKHLNVEIGLRLGSNSWVGADYWLQSTDPTITLDTILEGCELVAIGIDGGGLDDLLGLTVIGREIGTDRWLSWSRAWAHPSVLERRKSDVAPRLKDFQAQGDVVLVDEIGQDIDELADIVEQIHASGLMPDEHAIGVDIYGIDSVKKELAARKLDVEKLFIGISQGWKLNGAIKTAERALAAGDLRHADQPMMAWCLGNAKVEPKGNAVTITKQASGTAKIDPLMALFNAVAILAQHPESRRSVYEAEDRGLLMV